MCKLAGAVAVLSCLLLPLTAGAQDRTACETLISAVSGRLTADFVEQSQIVHQLAFEAGSSCISDLEQAFLSTENERLQYQISDALTAVGGRAAVAALRRLRQDSSEEIIRRALIATVGATGTSDRCGGGYESTLRFTDGSWVVETLRRLFIV